MVLTAPPALPEGETAEALLAAARTLFARHGFEGTSVREITRKAGANIAAVTYHFGSKRTLYEAVLISTLVPLRDRIYEVVQTSGSPPDRVEALVEALLVHLADTPELPRLMLHELAGGGPPAQAVQVLIQENVRMLAGLIREGQAEGSIRSGDPVLMAMSLVSQPVHLATALRPARVVLGMEESPEDLKNRMARHAAEFARRAVEAREDGS
jgi:AcrR family transcriptional regulator